MDTLYTIPLKDLVEKFEYPLDAVSLPDDYEKRLISSAEVHRPGLAITGFFDMFDEEIECDATTVNGWVMIELDRLPKVGDTFDYESRHKVFHVKVTKADARRALMTRIRVTDKQEEEN
jgi:CBS domain containing-hemolysin-like protein